MIVKIVKFVSNSNNLGLIILDMSILKGVVDPVIILGAPHCIIFSSYWSVDRADRGYH